MKRLLAIAAIGRPSKLHPTSPAEDAAQATWDDLSFSEQEYMCFLYYNNPTVLVDVARAEGLTEEEWDGIRSVTRASVRHERTPPGGTRVRDDPVPVEALPSLWRSRTGPRVETQRCGGCGAWVRKEVTQS